MLSGLLKRRTTAICDCVVVQLHSRSEAYILSRVHTSLSFTRYPPQNRLEANRYRRLCTTVPEQSQFYSINIASPKLKKR
ncbi:MAG: hypothetical protein PWP48_941 [Clostridiales bacterium]|jgi:hypothetical protein|nr:hypothetical protein [Clostridiales bacterium]